MHKIALLTCDRYPDLYDTDQKLIPVLHALGYQANAEIWDKPDAKWDEYDLIIFRNTWDYYLKADAFSDWLDILEKSGIRTSNPLSVIRWNKHKYYIRELQSAGFLVIPSIFIPQTNTLNILNLLPGDWPQAIIKPAISAGSYLTTLFDAKDAESVSLNYKDISKSQDLILQKFIPEIRTEGEISLVYFNKIFSHAVRKTPKKGDFRIQSIFGGKYEPYSPTEALLQSGQKIIDYINDDLLYARLDGVFIHDVFQLMELELIEPDLYLDHVRNGTEKFANVIHQYMQKLNF